MLMKVIHIGMKLKLIQSIHPDEGLKIKRKSQIGIKWGKLLNL
jgi:hypothetical protein